VEALCLRYLSSQVVARQVLSGSDGSAACGGKSDLSEWQRSTDKEGFSKPTKMSGTATGVHALNFCVWKDQQENCCLLQIQQPKSALGVAVQRRSTFKT